MNPYTYVSNNPVNRIDPTGEDWVNVALSGLSLAATGLGIAALVAGAPVIGVAAGTWFMFSAAFALVDIGYNYSKYRRGCMSKTDFWLSTALDFRSAGPIGWGASLVGFSYSLTTTLNPSAAPK